MYATYRKVFGQGRATMGSDIAMAMNPSYISPGLLIRHPISLFFLQNYSSIVRTGLPATIYRVPAPTSCVRLRLRSLATFLKLVLAVAQLPAILANPAPIF